MRIASLSSTILSLLFSALMLPLSAASAPALYVSGLVDDLPTQETLRGTTEQLTLQVTPAVGRTVDQTAVSLEVDGRIIPHDVALSNPAAGSYHYNWQVIEANNAELTFRAEDDLGQASTFVVPFAITATPPTLSVSGIDDIYDNSFPRGDRRLLDLEVTSPVGAAINAASVSLIVNNRTIAYNADYSDPNNGRFTFEWDVIEADTASLTFSAADVLGQSASTTRSANIEATPPHITFNTPYDTGPDPYSVQRGQHLLVDVTASSPMAPWLSINNDSVQLTVNGRVIPIDPDQSDFSNGGFAFDWQAVEAGSAELIITAEDNLGQSATASTTVIIDATPPQIFINNPHAGPDPYLVSRGDQVLVDVTVSSPMAPWLSINNDSVTLSVNGRAIPVDPDQSDVTNGWFVFDWQAIEEGTATLVITAEDELGQSATASTTVTIDPTPPTIFLDNIYEGMTVFRGFPYASNLSVQTNYNLSVDPSSVQLSINGTPFAYNSDLSDTEAGYFHFDLVFAALDTTAEIVFSAADNLGQTSNQSITVNVEATPPSMSINGIYDGDLLEPGQNIWIGMYVYPQLPDWSIDSDSAQMVIDGTVIEADPDWSDTSQNYFYFNWTVSGEGDVAILFRATDQFGQTGETNLTVQVQAANLPPVAEASIPDSLTDINGDGLVRLVADASASSDPEGDSLSFAWIVNGQQVSTSAALDTQLSVAGDHAIRLIVSDSQGASAQRDFDITVHPGPSLDDIIRHGYVDWTQTNRSDWHTITFNHRFENPVVIAQAQSYNGNQPFCLRVRNVTPTGCEIQLQEWAYLDGSHAEERIAWLAVEQGQFDLPDGSRIVAGVSQVGGNDISVSYASSAFSTAPVVLAQTQDDQIANPVCTRLNDVTSSGFKLRLQQEELLGKPTTTETVGWIARSLVSDPGNAVIARTGDNQNHNWRQTSTSTVFGSAVLVFPAMQDLDGGDTATVRIKDVEDGSFNAKIEEEQSRDNEVKHTTETIGYWMVPIDTGTNTLLGNG